MEQVRKEENRIDKRAINKSYFFAVPSMMLDDGYLPVVARWPIPHDLAKVENAVPYCPPHCHWWSVSHLIFTEYCINHILTSVPLHRSLFHFKIAAFSSSIRHSIESVHFVPPSSSSRWRCARLLHKVEAESDVGGLCGNRVSLLTVRVHVQHEGLWVTCNGFVT